MLEKYLPSVINFSTKDNCFIVVADNGSTDDSVQWLSTNYPQIQLITFEQNYGFTGGYNRALRQIDADYYILLNSDVEVTNGWIDPLINFMEDNPDVGVCQPKILSYTNKEYFEYAGAAGGFIDHFGYPFCKGRILQNIEKDNGQYNEPDEIFWASGACMMVRSSLFHHLGGFDELFFAHMEEIDFCWRAKLLGFQVWSVPSSTVYHLGGGALPNNSPKKLYLNFRNNLLMLRKNLPSKVHWRIITMRKILDGCSAIIYLLTGKTSYFKAVLDAHRDYNKMKKNIEPSIFTDEYNDIGHWHGSIVLRYYLSKGKVTFNKLRF